MQIGSDGNAGKTHEVSFERVSEKLCFKGRRVNPFYGYNLFYFYLPRLTLSSGRMIEVIEIFFSFESLSTSFFVYFFVPLGVG